MSLSTASQAIAPKSLSQPFCDDLREVIHQQIGSVIRDLEIEEIGREVVVSGVVSSYYVKQSVTHAVLPEIGRRTLTNAIRVIPRR